MSFRLVQKSMTLNVIMAVILRYFTEFGKHAFQHITASSAFFVMVRAGTAYRKI